MPRYSDQFKDEIRNRIRVSDIASKRVKLKRAGRELAGLSPFTTEKTPSFYVNDAKQIFKCFSSGIGGDVFQLYMEFENCTFPQAIEGLADLAGLDLPNYSPEERQKDDDRKLILDALDDAQAYFASVVHKSETAKKYLADRKIDAKAIDHWGIGYAPVSASAIPRELSARHSKSVLLAAGLIKENSRGDYGFYRDRITFPIRNQQGRVVSFGARSLDPEKKPKYLNGPDSPVFHKSHTLYGLDTAKRGLTEHRDAQGLILSEGYLDVIAFQRAGLPISVAPLGTSVTEVHMRELWRWGPEPIICLDGDAAGRRAALRLIKLALPSVEQGRTVLFAKMPTGQDPDDVLRQRGPDGLRDAVRNPVSMPRMIWEMEREQDALDTPERRTAFRSRLNDHLGLIRDKETARHYREAFFQWTRDHYRRGNAKPGASMSNGNLASHRGLGILITCIDNPDLIDEVAEDLALAHWSPECRAIFEVMFELYRDSTDVGRTIVVDLLLADFQSVAADMVEQYPRGNSVTAQDPIWASILKSIQHLNVQSHQPVTLHDAICEQRNRRGITKK